MTRRFGCLPGLLGMWLILALTGPLYGHGVLGEAGPGGMAVTFRFTSGEAMSFAKVTITSPKEGKTYQVGHTDPHGRFCFYPDAPGDWQVTADDNLGHRHTVTVPLSLEQLQDFQVKTTAPASVPLLERALVGLSLIFGMAGLLFYWRARKIRQSGS